MSRYLPFDEILIELSGICPACRDLAADFSDWCPGCALVFASGFAHICPACRDIFAAAVDAYDHW
jgi:predicted amidophosphoribosyltransferase